MDPAVDRQSFGNIVVDLLTAFHTIYPNYSLHLSTQAVVEGVVLAPPPFWHLSREQLQESPFYVLHPIFDSFVESVSQGNFIWFEQPYHEYIKFTYPQLYYPDSLYIYGALLLFIEPVYSASEALDAEANWYDAYKKYKEMVNLLELDDFDEKVALTCFEQRFGNRSEFSSLI